MCQRFFKKTEIHGGAPLGAHPGAFKNAYAFLHVHDLLVLMKLRTGYELQ